MYDEPTRLLLFGFDSGFSGSGDVDEVVDSGGMDVDVEGSGFAQQLARVLLTSFVWGIVRMWEEWGLYFLLWFNANSIEATTRENASSIGRLPCFVFE